MTVVAVIVVASILLFIWRRFREGFEGMEPVAEPVAVPVTMPAMAEPVATPSVNVAVGTIMDGPGMEPTGVMTGAFSNAVPDNYYMLSDGSANNAFSVQNNVCSKSCCSESWPTPFKQKTDPYVCAALKNEELVSSRMFCNNAFNDSGCMCLTKNQARFLYTRGGQGGEFF